MVSVIDSRLGDFCPWETIKYKDADYEHNAKMTAICNYMSDATEASAALRKEFGNYIVGINWKEVNK